MELSDLEAGFLGTRLQVLWRAFHTYDSPTEAKVEVARSSECFGLVVDASIVANLNTASLPSQTCMPAVSSLAR